MKTITKLALVITAAVTLVAGLPAAKANIICNNWSQGNFSGNQVFTYDYQSGSSGGNYANSYVCNNNLISYHVGSAYQGFCNVILDCNDGRSYFCSVSNWNGHDTIQWDGSPSGCNRIRVCAPVPEPSTIAAGALLLLPVGVSVLRILRKSKNQLVA